MTEEQAAAAKEAAEDRQNRLFGALGAAYDRYQRRAEAYGEGDATSPIWQRRETSAMAMVKEARDLAGRLEAELYDVR